MPDFTFDWQIIGLTFNILGAFFILNSLYFKRPKRHLQEYYGIEKRRPLRSIRDSVLSMVQLMIGFTFLIFGYVLQIGYQLSHTMDDVVAFWADPSVLQVAAVMILFMLLVTLVLKVFQILWTKWVFRRLLIDFYRKNRWALEKFPASAKEAGEVLGVPHSKDDSVAEYMSRLMAYLDIESDGEEDGAGESKSGQRSRTALPPEPTSAPTHPATPPRIVS